MAEPRVVVCDGARKPWFPDTQTNFDGIKSRCPHKHKHPRDKRECGEYHCFSGGVQHTVKCVVAKPMKEVHRG